MNISTGLHGWNSDSTSNNSHWIWNDKMRKCTSLFHDGEKRRDDIGDGLKLSGCKTSLLGINHRPQSVVQYPPPHFDFVKLRLLGRCSDCWTLGKKPAPKIWTLGLISAPDWFLLYFFLRWFWNFIFFALGHKSLAQWFLVLGLYIVNWIYKH